MRILFATDGSSHSEKAARTISALGLSSDTEIIIISVVEPPHYTMTPAVPPPYHEEWHRVRHELHMEAEEAAARAIEQAKQILMGVGTSVNSLILEGHPAEEIVRASEELGADLVVVGAKGMTSYQMFLLGSVSQKVIKYAPCSVLVARPAESLEQPTITRILLATDGSENAIEASRFLSPFRLRDDAEITILHVLHHRHGWIPRSGFTEKALEQVEQVHLESAKRLVENARANLHTDAKIAISIKEGDPAEQILKTGSEIDADLIVMGSAGLSGIKLFLLGSVAQKVSRYSDRSVMLVKLRRTSSHGERM